MRLLPGDTTNGELINLYYQFRIMRRLLLTSDGFVNRNIADRFLQMMDKRPSEINVLFIPTASRTDEELQYVAESKDELIELGIESSNIRVLDLVQAVTSEDIQNVDVVYVCGGNTFYLMKQIRVTGFDKAIRELVASGVLYIGVSAGSIVAGPNISIAGPYDENDVGLTDFSGLGLSNVVISPHYTEADSSIVEKFRKNLPYEIFPLRDGQALVVVDDHTDIIE